MQPRRPFVGGNWKMNASLDSARALASEVARALSGVTEVQTTIFPPFPYLLPVAEALSAGSAVRLGAQDFYPKPDGAFTGEVSLAMLTDCGVSVVLTGHSERRHVIGETDELVNAKTAAALAAGFECILCIGETLEQRLAGRTDEVNARQLRAGLAGIPASHMPRLTIAYEPVWAIGTGKTATAADAQDAHAKGRALLASLYSPTIAAATRIQYGGSVKGSNAAELFAQPDIDGGLIGGASLDAGEFIRIVRAAGAAKLHP
jgi:triosephosphate isomerase (TIM)